MRRLAYLPLPLVERAARAAADVGASRVARSKRGFLWRYREAGGDPEALSAAWQDKRDGFVARHGVQMRAEGDGTGWRDGRPTRRHLALAVWAWSPSPRRLASWLQKEGY